MSQFDARTPRPFTDQADQRGWPPSMPWSGAASPSQGMPPDGAPKWTGALPWDSFPELAPLQERSPTPSAPVSPRRLPSPPRGYYGTTGFGLKVRLLGALCTLALVPAFLYVVVGQNATQALALQESQQVLQTAAAANAAAVTTHFTSLQATTQRLVEDPAIAQASQPPAGVQAAEGVLRGASSSFPGSFLWAVVSGNDHILASWPDTAGQALSHLSVLHDSTSLETFVQQARHAPPQKAGQFPPVGVGSDAGKFWLAAVAWMTPADQGHSALILALCALEAGIQPFLSSPTSGGYTVVLDTTGTVLAVQGNAALSKQVGASISIPPLRQAAASAQDEVLLQFADPVNGAQLMSVGVSCGPASLFWTCLVVSPAAAVVPQPGGLLDPRNTPLVLLTLIVVVLLAGTWAALPVLRPIRGATRQIVASVMGMRQISNDTASQGLETVTIKRSISNLVRGMFLRNTKLLQKAQQLHELYVESALALVEMSHHVGDTANPKWFEQKIRESYFPLQKADDVTENIIDEGKQLSAEAKLNAILAGMEDMHLTVLASQKAQKDRVDEMEASARKIARALAQGRGNKAAPPHPQEKL